MAAEILAASDTSVDMHAERPDWLLFRDGYPGGEMPAEVAARADRVPYQGRAGVLERHFAPLRDTLLTQGDHYMHLTDLAAYLEADRKLVELYAGREGWARKAILNMASSESSPATEYTAEIWRAKACPLE